MSGMTDVPDAVAAVLDTPELLRLVLSATSDASTIGRAAQCARAWSSVAGSDEVWHTALASFDPCKPSPSAADAPAVADTAGALQKLALDLIAGVAIHEAVMASAVDPLRTRYHALAHGICGSCEAGAARSDGRRVIVCRGCQRVACTRCRPTPGCTSRCKACGGTACCPACDDTSPTAASRVWCECCLRRCGACAALVCPAHLRAQLGRPLCARCAGDEHGDCMRMRARCLGLQQQLGPVAGGRGCGRSGGRGSGRGGGRSDGWAWWRAWCRWRARWRAWWRAGVVLAAGVSLAVYGTSRLDKPNRVNK